MLDLNLYPLHIKDSVEQAYLPGLHFSVSPKYAVRSRQGDQIILLITAINELVISQDRLRESLENAAAEYYKSSGTVTAGLKRCAEYLNDMVLEFNLKESSGGHQQSCMLNIAVIRENRVYIAHAGYTHSFVLNKNKTEHFFDPETSGRGIGLSRTTTLRFFLSELASDEYILFSPEPLATWTPANLAGSPSIALDYLRRRLLNQVSPNIRALLVQSVDGPGRVILQAPLSSKSGFFVPQPANGTTTQPSQPAQTVTKDGRYVPAMAVPSTRPVPLEQQIEPKHDGVSPVAGQKTIIKPLPVPSSDDLEDDMEPGFLEGFKALSKEAVEKSKNLGNRLGKFTSRFKKPLSADGEIIDDTARQPRIPINTEPLRRSFVKLEKGASVAANITGKTLQRTAATMGGVVGGAVEYITPDGGFRLPQISLKALILISIIVPLVMVAAGSSIYFQRGRSAQFTQYYNQAEALAAQASSQKDPDDVRESWEQALALLDQAEKYGNNEKSKTLRQQAQDVLDDVEGIGRLDFASALPENLPAGTKITRMRATTTDLFMLDSSDGKILRALLTGRGFELDTSFKCAPGPYGSYVVESFVDFAIMPKGNSLGAALAALDKNGNIVYCGSGTSATSMTLMPPDTGWGSIDKVAIDSGRLYVMDKNSNAIWVYIGSGGTFSESPELFFNKDIPELGDVSDFSINVNDLYMLHEDGHLTTCTYGAISGTATKCKDPAPFSIERPGVKNKPVIIPETAFSQIQYSAPPDPSIYLLDTEGVSIYHFSVKLAMMKQLSVQAGDPQQLLKRKPTAFTVNPAKVVFMAFDNKVYSAVSP